MPEHERVDLAFGPLSSSPWSVPSATVEGLTVDAGFGSTSPRAWPPSWFLVKFHGTSQEMLDARQATGDSLPSKLATALTGYHLRDYTTWCCSSSGCVQSSQRVL